LCPASASCPLLASTTTASLAPRRFRRPRPTCGRSRRSAPPRRRGPRGARRWPDSWWTQNGIYGHGYYSKGGIADAGLGKAVYVYPNGQEAAPIWFHDHMLGATRLNVYAGIAGGYVVTEPRAPTPRACTRSA